VPFGGKVVVFSGDFKQCLPVVPHGSDDDAFAASVQTLNFWNNHVRRYQLNVNERIRRLMLAGQDTAEFVEWAQFLLDVGHGRGACADEVSIPVTARATATSLEGLVREVYDNFDGPTDFVTRAVLAPRNVQVDEANDIAIRLFPGTAITRYSRDSLDPEYADTSCPLEVLNSINPPDFPPHRLVLKEQMPVMLLRNLNLGAGLSNGTRLKVIDARQHVIKTEILTGPRTGEIAFIPRIMLDSKKENSPFVFQRQQFPLRPAFALTINKAQGQTFERVGLDVTLECFSHGQLYVALSRVGHPSRLRVLAKDLDRVRNVVCRQIHHAVVQLDAEA